MSKIPVIIDCDPGIDDALALFLACSSDKLDIRAITPVAGNVPLEHTSSNTLRLLELMGKDIKVALGADGPLVGERETAESVHGEAGLGTTVLELKNKVFHSKDAIETIYEEAKACNGELRLIVLGPNTTIALALKKYPELKDMIHSITIMGGGVNVGNVTKYAEFNIFADSEAAKIVFESGIEINMIGLNVTNRATLLEDDIKEIGTYNNKVAKVAAELLEFMIPVYKGFGQDGASMHDPITVAYLIDNSIFEMEKHCVTVEVENEERKGETVVHLDKENGQVANVNVAMNADFSAFKNMLKEALKAY